MICIHFCWIYVDHCGQRISDQKHMFWLSVVHMIWLHLACNFRPLVLGNWVWFSICWRLKVTGMWLVEGTKNVKCTDNIHLHTCPTFILHRGYFSINGLTMQTNIHHYCSVSDMKIQYTGIMGIMLFNIEHFKIQFWTNTYKSKTFGQCRFIIWPKKYPYYPRFFSSLLIFFQKRKCDKYFVNYDCFYFEPKSFPEVSRSRIPLWDASYLASWVCIFGAFCFGNSTSFSGQSSGFK